MKKILFLFFLYQLIFSNCSNSQHATTNLSGWENFNAEHYDDSKTIGISGYARYDLRPDSVYFYAKYKSSEVLDNLSFNSFNSLFTTFMSATKQEHYDTIFVSGNAPTIDPKFERGRYAKDRLRLDASIKISNNNERYEIVRVEKSLAYQEKSTTEIFIFIINDEGSYRMIMETPPNLLKLVSIMKRIKGSAGYHLFDIKSRYAKEEKESFAVTELKDYAFTMKGKKMSRHLDVDRFIFLINKWLANGESQKINSIYEKS